MNRWPESEKLLLFWPDDKNKRHYFAGVAFREERFGEYRLKIDCYPNRRLYLKACKAENGRIDFKVEEVRKIKEETIRSQAGHAHSDADTGDDVEIFIVPNLQAKLVLSFEEKK